MFLWAFVALMLWSCSFLASVSGNPAGKMTTCTVSTDDVKSTRTVSVTCHYGADVISRRPLSLSVDFYPRQNSSELMGECQWRREGDEGTCSTPEKSRHTIAPSAAIPGDVILTISDVTGRDAGRYVCQHISRVTVSARFQPCLLSKEDIPSGPSDVTDPAGSAAKPGSHVSASTEFTTLPGTAEETGTAAAEAGTGSDQTILLVAILVPVTVVVTAAIAAGCLVYRRHRSRANIQKEDPEEGKALSSTQREQLNHVPESAPQEEGGEPPPEDEEHEAVDPETAEQDDGVPKNVFETELLTTAAVMQTTIQPKVKDGKYSPRPTRS